MDNAPESLTPHAYPLWIKAGSVVCLVFFIISLTYFPYYFQLKDKFKSANTLFQSGNYEQASVQYKELCTLLPEHKKVKLRVAEALFKSSQLEDHKMALDYLATVTLDTYEWKELLAYMPTEYEAHFQDVKVKA